MNQVLNLYQTVLFILSQQSREVAPGAYPVIDTSTLKFYWAVGEGRSDIQLIPIGDESPTNIEYDMSPEKFVRLSDFAENNGKMRMLCGKFAESLQKFCGRFADDLRKNQGFFADASQDKSGNIAALLQNASGSDAELSRRVIGKGIIDRNSVSHFYVGDLHKVMSSIESLTDKIVRATEKEQTIKIAATRFDEAVMVAAGNDSNKIERLRNIQEKLKISRDRQLRRHEQNRVDEMRTNPVRNFKIWLVAVCVSGCVLFAVYYFSIDYIKSVLSNSTGIIKNTAVVDTVNRRVFTKYEIDLVIKEVSQMYNTKIWDWRRSKIYEATIEKNLSTDELLSTVENLVITKNNAQYEYK